MLKPTNSHAVRRDFHSKLIPLYAVSILLVFTSNLIAYVNSSYIKSFLPETMVGYVFLSASSLALVTFLFVARVLKKIGNYKMMFTLLILNALALLGMSYFHTPALGIGLFMAHFVIMPLLFYSTDVFLEAELDNKESSTGSKRGLLLTLIGFAGAVAPLVMSVSIPESGSLDLVFRLAAVSMIPIIAIMAINLRHFKDPKYTELDIFAAVSSFWKQKDVRGVYLAALTLNMFFAFTVIYMPLYLVGEIGLSWEKFGTLMSIAVLAYLIFEYPVGVIADRFTGEKEFMAAGFMILAITIALMAAMETTSFLYWAILMFTMRIGASIVEVTTESYFFKKTKSSDAQIISFFRTTRPLSYIILASISSFALYYLPFNLLFVVGAILMLPAMFIAMGLKDTK